MKPRVYVETTVVSYLTAWPSREPVMAGQLQLTREWWRTAERRFELVTSDLVLREAGAGDPAAAQERLAAIDSLPPLNATRAAEDLARRLVESDAIPATAAEDAAHIAIAVVHGIDYLVTWNFRHIANATMRTRIERDCLAAGYEPTIICTPAELMEPRDVD